MSILHVPAVDDIAIRSLVGAAAFERGRAYARKRAVVKIAWDDDGGQLSGSVRGTAGAPYRTKVRLHRVNGGIRPTQGQCSCPMSTNCKHVAALLLTGNAEFSGALASGTTTATARAARLPAPPVPTHQHEPAAWQKKLDSLVHAVPENALGYPGSQGTQTHAPASAVSLAVQFELQQVQAPVPAWVSRTDMWNPDADTRFRLGVRPVKRNARGNWVREQLRWQAFQYSSYTHEYDRAQLEWMRTFLAVYGAARMNPSHDAWIYLDDFNSPLLWQLLGQAGAAGVELVGARAGTAVVVHDPLTVSLDVRADQDGLRLLPHADLDGQPLNPAAMGLIGRPGHGLFWWDEAAGPKASLQPRSIGLAPSTAPISDTVRPLIANRTSLEIPASGRDTFMGTYFPQLRQSTELRSGDGSVDFPELLPPELVLTAVHVPEPEPSGRGAQKRQPGPGSLQLQWGWEYTADGVPARRPLLNDGIGYRDARFETQVLDQAAELLAPFAPAVQDTFPHRASRYPGSNAPVALSGVDAARFTTDALPLLAALEHVRVDTDGASPDYEELTHTPQIGISTSSTDDGDWFDLGVTVTLGNTDVPFDHLFRALAAGEEHLMLSNGNYFVLDQPEFIQLRRLIEEARSLQDTESGLRISRYQAGLWDELEELAATAEQAEAWRKSVTGLLNLSEVPATPIPSGINASLRPYQHEGFNWLAFLWEHGLGGVLADDMGLGKTLQTLALICHAKNAVAQQHGTSGSTSAEELTARCADAGDRPFLVVAPTSVVPNWAAEAARFAPGLRTVAVTDTLRRSGTDPTALAGGTDVVVVSYTLFRLDYEAYAAQQWAGLILDEAQFVKNPATKASQNARRFPAPFKLAITGTPMENNLMELWSMFAITAPGLFTSSKNFADYYQKPVEKEADADRLAQLRRRIRPLIMRRTKEVVAKELPPKQEQILALELAPRHRTIYQRHLQRERQKVLGMLGDMDKNRFAIFKSLTTLRMLSLDASLVDKKYASAPSSKLDVLFEQLEDIVAEGHRTLIFSQFTSFLRKAAERLDAAGIEYAYLDGKTRRRGDVIEKFKSGTAPVFLISLKAGGFGLNLTEADYCFLLDPWWNPATENQAVDRTHRIGQHKNVMVYRLVAKDTIEEKVMALKDKKAKLFSAVMDDDAMFSSALSAEDVRGLFAG